MAKLDMTLGKAIFKDVYGYEPLTPEAKEVRDLQVGAFATMAIEAASDWKALVKNEGGVFTDSPFLYPDWTGGALMDGQS